MLTEQQARDQRIQVARSVEARDLKTGSCTTGYTKNLSGGGVRARMDHAFRAGEILELNMILESDHEPITTHGEVIWCSGEIYGDGAEVGLKFVDPPKYDEPNEDTASTLETKSPSLPFEVGSRVTLLAGDKTLLAVVEEVSETDVETGDPIHVHLRIHSTDEVQTKQEEESDADILASVEDWRADPVRDAKKWFDKYVSPIIRILRSIIVPIAILFARWTRKLWKKVPLRPRIRIESFFARFRLGYRASQIKKACITAISFINRRLQLVRNS